MPDGRNGKLGDGFAKGFSSPIDPIRQQQDHLYFPKIIAIHLPMTIGHFLTILVMFFSHSEN
jgi:hypothetical protein